VASLVLTNRGEQAQAVEAPRVSTSKLRGIPWLAVSPLVTLATLCLALQFPLGLGMTGAWILRYPLQNAVLRDLGDPRYGAACACAPWRQEGGRAAAMG
jgi:hypothetical protein